MTPKQLSDAIQRGFYFALIVVALIAVTLVIGGASINWPWK